MLNYFVLFEKFNFTSTSLIFFSFCCIYHLKIKGPFLPTFIPKS